MKKLAFAIMVLIMGTAVKQANAQFSIGPGIGFATDISSLGLSANAAYQIDESWAATASFTYFLEKDYLQWTAFDFNANYNLTDIENLGTLYGIGGINITSVSFDFPGIDDDMFDSSSHSEFGVNLGAGLNVDLSEKMVLAPEMMFTISDINYFRIGAKLMFAL
ncbi:outer membrane beta-barrel protein [Sunxiuqinia elliptica]|uniref:Outer membrane protein with beta-barrel domain n=1 Tax=Sunxiuqinia elliptica TaxID=655355 RepID=A0A4R6GUR6_9BACT|nr:outer membrane beta-barrel protein [Sunxiuqinia elliptica]TDN99073.1 outer membrane protein with beta-barrel domain [Sunxiuqinia elliptica]TDO56513.1 outer membrane protein with beta-barrel domain [Sunxiuqinia elliptica]